MPQTDFNQQEQLAEARRLRRLERERVRRARQHAAERQVRRKDGAEPLDEKRNCPAAERADFPKSAAVRRAFRRGKENVDVDERDEHAGGKLCKKTHRKRAARQKRPRADASAGSR